MKPGAKVTFNFAASSALVTQSALGPEPEGAPMEQQLIGWKNSWESGKGVHTTTSGFEGAWNATPTRWDNKYLETLMDNEWVLTESPAGHKQWTAPALAGTVPDALGRVRDGLRGRCFYLLPGAWCLVPTCPTIPESSTRRRVP